MVSRILPRSPVDEANIKGDVAVQVDDLVGTMKRRHEARMRIQEWESKQVTPVQYGALLRQNLPLAVSAVDTGKCIS